MPITRLKRILIPAFLTLLLCACGGKTPVETDTAPLKVSPASQSVVALGEMKSFTVVSATDWYARSSAAWNIVKKGDTVDFKCDIAIDGDAPKPIYALDSTMYQLMTDGQDASDTPGPAASLYFKYDPKTFPVVSKDLSKVWIVEVDGRQDWYSLGIKGYELYRIAKKLGGWWATGLDGGGSSAVWLWDPATSKGSIVNRPSDSKGERSDLSYWAIKQK